MAVTVERRGSVGILWLAEPDSHHALSVSLVQALLSALDSEPIRSARALVLASTGAYFCAGANINDLRNGWMDGSAPQTEPGRFFERLASDPRPVVAAIDAGAIGGGFELMLCCDLAIASQEAWFCLPEVQHGVIANTALLRLQQMVGLRTLLFYAFTGEKLSAQQAQVMGLVNEVVPTAQAVPAAVALAERIVSRASPGALALTKRYAHHHAQTDWAIVDASLREVPASEWQEGLSAFAERRRPNYDQQWQAATAARLTSK
jgi:enoyl-CoA hydratase/carnithine racemase